MNQFIVPVDFSETSKNAARFAASLTMKVNQAQLILYHVYGRIEAGSDGTPLGGDKEARKRIAELALQSVRNELSSLTDAKITIVAEESDHFVRALEHYVRGHHIQLIIMGITGTNRLGQILMGSNTLEVVRRKIAPVIIVPPEAQFKGASNIMLISDFKDVENTMPLVPITKVLALFHPNLHVVNIDDTHYIELTSEYKVQKDKLNQKLKAFHPEFSFLRMFDFVDSINQFVEDHDIDLILMVPRDHSFFSTIFKQSHTAKLAYHSHVPIISVHD
jgi:nucleotide-binding universal stress UspA family protein